MERSLSLGKVNGRVAMIVPNKFFHTKSATQLRELFSDRKRMQEVVDFGDAKVFSGATNYSCLLFLAHNATRTVRYIEAQAGLAVRRKTSVPRSSLTAEPWHFEDARKRAPFKKLEETGVPLETLVNRFGTGVQSGADRILTIEAGEAKKLGLERDVLRRTLRGRDVRRYAVGRHPRLLIFPYKVDGDSFVLLLEPELEKRKRVYKLLCENRRTLDSRLWFGKRARVLSGEWYGLMYLDSCTSFSSPHILTPSLSNRANFAIGHGDLFATGTAGVTSIICRSDILEDIRYLLGMLNSRLLSFYAVGHSPVFSGAYYKFSAPYVRRIPIRRINPSDRADGMAHDRIVKLVAGMLQLHETLAAARSVAQKEVIRRQIVATDSEIDHLVYDLYGLTPSEVAIVEAE